MGDARMKIPFYYDYTCPWAYLGATRVEAYFSDLPVVIDYRPVHLASIREPMEGPKPVGDPQTLGPRKRHYQAQDLPNWAEYVGAEFGDRSKLKRVDTALLLKGALVAQEAGCFAGYHYPAYRARWAEGRDVSEPDVVRALLAGAGLDGEAALAQAQSEAMAQRLQQACDEAMLRGVFGVPTIAVGDRLFWGNDRFELAHYYIRKALDADSVQRASA
jgi:2-hydroxychromene-2-carboxylate isomerase